MRISHTLIGFAAAASICGAEASAAVLNATAILHTTTNADTSATFADTALTGFGSLEDLTLDEARARADLAAGELKYLARDGGIFSGAPIPGATASATMRETLTLNGPASGEAELFTVGLSFTAAVDTAIATAGGVFNQVITADGASASGRFDFSVIESGVLNGFPREQSQSVRATFSQGTAFRFNDQGVLVDEFFFQEPRGIAETFPIQSTIGTRVVETRAEFETISSLFYSGLLEIDLLIAGSHTFDFLASASGNVEGAAARTAGINAFNTASLFVQVPDGGSFTSGSGLFLTAAPPPPSAAVPLPAPAFLLAGALAAFALAGRRRRS